MSSELKNETAAATEAATKIPAGEHADDLPSIWDDETEGLALAEEAAGAAPEMAEFAGRDELLRSIEAFRLADEERVDRYGDKSPPAAYWPYIDRVIEAAGDVVAGTLNLESIPERAHDILNRVVMLMRAFADFRSRANRTRPSYVSRDEELTLPAPFAGLLDTYPLLFEAADNIDTPPIAPCRNESIEQLKKDGVSIAQIAHIYRISPEEVFREIEKPGSVIGPNYVQPGVRDRIALRKTECKQIQLLQHAAAVIRARRAAVAAGASPDFV